MIGNLTLRERTELHRSDPGLCQLPSITRPDRVRTGKLRCHRTLARPGRKGPGNRCLRRASGRQESFSNPKELKTIIAEHNAKFSRNLVKRLLAYALCRRLEGYDEIVVDELMQKIAQDDYRMQTLITAVLTSYPFMHRRIE